jgi:hypothetical protein
MSRYPSGSAWREAFNISKITCVLVRLADLSQKPMTIVKPVARPNIADLWRLDRLVRIENDLIEQPDLVTKRRSRNTTPNTTFNTFLEALDSPSHANCRGCTLFPLLDRSDMSNNHALPQPIYNPTTLLDAYVSRLNQSPMEDITRQRRQANRELLRIAKPRERLTGSYNDNFGNKAPVYISGLRTGRRAA